MCIKFGKGAQLPKNLRAIGRVYCVMQGSVACSYSLIWFWWSSRTHTDSISVFGRFWSPRVFPAYYALVSKSRRFLTLINAFLCLRRKKAWDGKKISPETFTDKALLLCKVNKSWLILAKSRGVSWPQAGPNCTPTGTMLHLLFRHVPQPIAPIALRLITERWNMLFV